MVGGKGLVMNCIDFYSLTLNIWVLICVFQSKTVPWL